MSIPSFLKRLILFPEQGGRGALKTRGKSVGKPVSQEQVAILAQKIWEEEGRPEGKADEHWRRAEAQLQAPGRVQRGSNQLASRDDL